MNPKTTVGTDTLAYLLDEISSRWSERVALVSVSDYRTRRYTFEQVRSAALGVAAWLKERGIASGDRVVICSSTRPEALFLLLGCGISGVEAVPVDRGVSPEALEKVIRAARPVLVATDREDVLENRCEGPVYFSLPYLMGEARPIEGLDCSAWTENLSEKDPLFLFYTSGTTGEPKGVPISQGALVFDVRAVTELDDFERGDRMLSMAPLSHVLGLTIGLLIPWYVGNTIVHSSNMAPAHLLEILKREDVNCIVSVPAFLDRARERIEERLRDGLGAKRLERLLEISARLPVSLRRRLFHPVLRGFAPELKWLVSGGAPLSPATQRFWEALGIVVLQGYGLTETMVSTSNSFIDHRLGSVGRPVPGMEIKIDDQGEVLLRGPNVFSGYLDRPEENADVFHDGWFHTGDIGRLDERGNLFITGRAKNVIVSDAGINVYPEDIELILNQSDRVDDGIVLESPTHTGQIWAVILSQSFEKDLDLEALRKNLNQQLSQHQRIQRLIPWWCEDFPRTSTLKVKRGEVAEMLKKQFVSKGIIDKETAQSRELESVDHDEDVTSIIADIAQVECSQIRPQTRLGSDLGLDSIGLCELAAALEEKTGTAVSFEALLNGDLSMRELEQLLRSSPEAQTMSPITEWTEGLLTKTAQAITRRVIPFFMNRTFTLDVTGLEQVELLDDEPYIIVANHCSHLDWLSIWTALPVAHRRRLCPAAAYDYFYKGKSKTSIFLLHSLAPFLPWRRGANPTQVLKEVGLRLDRGQSVLVFPEGTRSRTGTLGDFKATIGLMARELGVPVLPVFIRGTHELWPPHEQRPRLGGIELEFGVPQHFDCHYQPHEIRDQLHSLYTSNVPIEQKAAAA